MDNNEKTYKRETAVFLFVVLFLFYVASFFYPQAASAAEMLTTPTFLFGGAAFGMDSYSKQIKR